MTHDSPSIPLHVTAAGAVSSLGPSWGPAFAVAHAGLVRTSEVAYAVATPDTNEEEVVLAHALTVGATGFSGLGRLRRLMQLALEDLARQRDVTTLDPARTGFVLVVPEAFRSRRAMAMEEVDEGDSYPNPLVDPTETARPAEEWLADLRRFTGCRIADANFVHLAADDTGVLDGLREVATRFAAGAWDSCLLLAADSLIEPATLDWLLAHERLKCGANPLGLRPGEAGVALVVERTAASPLGTVEGVSVAQEEFAQTSGDPSSGRGIAGAVAQLVQATGRAGALGWVVSDANGETYAAHDLGNAYVQIRRTDPSFGAAGTTFPATSFGDTGVASAGVSLLHGISGIRRRRLPTDRTVILSAGLHGRRAAALLSAAPAR